MTIPIRKRIVKNRKETVKDERKLVFEREKEKYKGLLLHICVIGIRRDSIIVIPRRFNILVHFLLTWYAFIFNKLNNLNSYFPKRNKNQCRVIFKSVSNIYNCEFYNNFFFYWAIVDL